MVPPPWYTLRDAVRNRSTRRIEMTNSTSPSGIDALVEAARAVRLNAHAPYSRFAVGASVLAGNGMREDVFSGCNVENAAFGSTMCAERNALAAAVAAGFRDIREIVVYTEAAIPTTPCGACRQVMQELAPAARVHLASPSGVHGAMSVSELFPHPFGPASLGG
jgi:cytidine deaminase